jgi:hypothetical protein
MTEMERERELDQEATEELVARREAVAEERAARGNPGASVGANDATVETRDNVPEGGE